MSRDDVLNTVLSLFAEPSYLEIGVSAGHTFFHVRAATKTAVDPHFVFDTAARQAPGVTFRGMTSDAFFGPGIAKEPFDVIYLDGLHTGDQILRDLMNAVSWLKPRGVIVIDDVVPNSYHASLPDERMATLVRQKLYPQSTDYSWMGDVYKIVFFVESFLQQFSYATVADNHGQMVLWREPRDIADPRTLRQVADADYLSVWAEEPAFRKMSMNDIVGRLRSRR